jgi:two-component system osmolarity sensor histidine kinase EnvZ
MSESTTPKSTSPYKRFTRRIEALLRRVAPRGLLGRSILIIVLPVLLTQALMTWYFFDRHWDFISRRLASVTAGEIAMLLDTHEASAGQMNWEELAPIATRNMRLNISFSPGENLPEVQPRTAFSLLDDTLQRELGQRLNRPFWFDLTSRPEFLEIRVEVDGGVLHVLTRQDRVFVTNGHIFLAYLIITGTLLLAVAFLFLRNQVRPISRLATAAESFGKGIDQPEFKPAGAREVRRAALAFIQMRDRIYRHIHQRTEMLAGVSHDLRTPLTRMKLELALMDDEDASVEALKSDVEEMGRMLEEYLEFARGQRSESASPTNLTELLDHVAADMVRQGLKVEFDADRDLSATVRAQAIRRAVNNLLDNAATYGTHVRLTARAMGPQIEITVDDDGPGIPPQLREEAFRPFRRLDEARNQDAGGGVGLGLSIARDIARAHGGDIMLSDSPMGGLRARLVLPT